MNLLRLLLPVLCLALPTSAFGDPVTYRGKLGSIDIVVELNVDPTAGGPVAGRYFYLSRGVDIPLQAASRDRGGFRLAEEEPCNAEKCGNGETPPVGAEWSLTPGAGGSLKGMWKSAKRSLPLSLTRVGVRKDEDAATPLALHEFSGRFGHSTDMPITMETSPYDVLRLDVALGRGNGGGWGDATFDYAVDPRTKFAMPRVVSLSGGPVDAANARLTDSHWRHSLSAFSCAALQYAGFNEFGPSAGSDDGSFGGVEDIYTDVRALTPRVMSWQESGSLYCGGAHPYNFTNHFVMDVETGELLDLAGMFSDVTDGRPGETLADFVRQTRDKPADKASVEFEQECGIDELIGEYLAASLRRDGDRLSVVFGLDGLPHAINSCADDLLELPVSKVGHLMTRRFAALVGLR